jgi:hypothetical protein
MAKDEAQPNTPAPAPLDRLSVNEAVALIVSLLPPHDADAVWAAMRNALANGTLRDCPCDGPYRGRSTEPNTWRRWFYEDRVDRRTGEVFFPPRPGQLRSGGHFLRQITPPPIRPQLLRQDVFKLFGITEAEPTTIATTEPEPVTIATTEPEPTTIAVTLETGVSLITAIRKRLDSGDRPGERGTVTWDMFCHNIRTDCDAYIGDPRDNKPRRGFSDINIKRVTRDEMQRR